MKLMFSGSRGVIGFEAGLLEAPDALKLLDALLDQEEKGKAYKEVIMSNSFYTDESFYLIFPFETFKVAIMFVEQLILLAQREGKDMQRAEVLLRSAQMWHAQVAPLQ